MSIVMQVWVFSSSQHWSPTSREQRAVDSLPVTAVGVQCKTADV